LLVKPLLLCLSPGRQSSSRHVGDEREPTMGANEQPQAFVPDEFIVPRELVTPRFRLEPLGPQHNADDHEAWTSSIEHIRATPGFPIGR
jgi:hypothetical protein